MPHQTRLHPWMCHASERNICQPALWRTDKICSGEHNDGMLTQALPQFTLCKPIQRGITMELTLEAVQVVTGPRQANNSPKLSRCDGSSGTLSNMLMNKIGLYFDREGHRESHLKLAFPCVWAVSQLQPPYGSCHGQTTRWFKPNFGISMQILSRTSMQANFLRALDVLEEDQCATIVTHDSRRRPQECEH